MQLQLLQILLSALLVSLSLNAGTQENVYEPVIPEISTSTVQAVVSSTVPEVPPMLKRIGGCESGGGANMPPRQFNPDGTVIRGKANPQDIGAYQINLYWNGAKAKELGYDLFTLEGNTKMALYLYETRGTKDWNWSKHCWGK